MLAAVIHAIRTGGAGQQWLGSYQRKDEPAGFWMLVGLWSFFAASCFYVAAALASIFKLRHYRSGEWLGPDG